MGWAGEAGTSIVADRTLPGVCSFSNVIDRLERERGEMNTTHTIKKKVLALLFEATISSKHELVTTRYRDVFQSPLFSTYRLCIADLGKFKMAWWFPLRIEPIFAQDPASPKMLLTSKVVKSDSIYFKK